ncbi:MAG: Gfo/Idh/MocA family oxidoreductase [Planctomycetes bacterium]|nr:Gfo/Idh/MocA family oxidoreductase [Planctomycetota bacterium]
MSYLPRREFLQRSTMGSAALLAGASALADTDASVVAPHDRIRLAFIGYGGRAAAHVAGFAARNDCELVAVCDVNQRQLEAGRQHIRTLTRTDPKTYLDMHDLLADRSLDAVIISTPDHWHTPAAIYACQAGKDVYVEKPVTNNVWEGRKLVEAARKYKRIVQVGTQNRSAPYNLAARDYLHSGKLGEIHLVRVYNQKYLGTVKMSSDGPQPDYLDWDKWQGPAPARPFNASRWTNWHDFWDYAGGDVTNDTVHQIDLACMALGIDALPRSVYAQGLARRGSDSQMPDTLAATFEFDNLIMTFNQTLYTPYMIKADMVVRNSDIFPHWPQDADRIEIFGSEAVMVLGRHGCGFQVFGRMKDRQPVVVAQQHGRFPDKEHQANFVDCVRSRKLPNADVQIGHRTAAMCHLANLSYRVGNQFLQVDPQTEQITNNEQAAKLMKPEYRAPYVIAENV